MAGENFFKKTARYDGLPVYKASYDLFISLML